MLSGALVFGVFKGVNMFWFVLIVHTIWLTLAIGQMYTKEPIEPWRYFVAVLACTIWAVPSAFKTFGG